MVEKLKGYRVDDQVFATREEAERHEGHLELTAWIAKTMAEAATGQEAPVLADQIVSQQARLVPLLRKAGVKMITKPRKAKPEATAEKPAKAAAE